MSPALALLIAGMIQVESNGVNGALGKHGEVGCLQISRGVVQDVNHIQSHVRFTFSDALNRDRSIAMCRIYLAHYATAERIGREPTERDMAMIWHHGPDGWAKHDFDGYWPKVVAAMKENAR